MRTRPNVGGAHAYQGQSAGYYTGGSISTRGNIHQLEIADVQLPGYHAGCGGIDFFTGGFSFINAKEIESFAKNVINNALGYSFALGMDVVSPLVGNEMKYFMSMANKINQANLNSCETAEALVGGIWPKIDASQRKVCEDLSMSDNILAGWAQAREACGNGGQMGELLDRAKSDPRYTARVLDNTNIVWKALRQNAFLRSDDMLAEFFMSLSGTVVVTRQQGTEGGKRESNQLKSFPSLANSKNLLNALLKGGEATIYRCGEERAADKDDCLYVIKKKVKISEKQALLTRVRLLLLGMVTKIQTNVALDDKEKSFLNAVSLPVYKLLNVQVAFKGHNAVIDVDQYANIIATDLLSHYLHDSLLLTRQSINTLQFSKEALEEYVSGIDQALMTLRTSQEERLQNFTQIQQLQQQTEQVEQMLADHLSNNLFNSLEWAKEM